MSRYVAILPIALVAAALPVFSQSNVELRVRFAIADAQTEAAFAGVTPAAETAGAKLLLLSADTPGLQTFAETKVTAVAGTGAKFLAGGEFPMPVQNESGGLKIEFREYGIRLNFLPAVKPDGEMNLNVAAQISSLDFAHPFTIQGLPVPGMATRTIASALDLRPGQSFAITGLFTPELVDSLARLPGAASIPVLKELAGLHPPNVVILVAM